MSWRTLVFSALIAVTFVFVSFLARSGLKDTTRPPNDRGAGVERKDRPHPTTETHDPMAYPPTTLVATPLPTEKREAAKNQLVPVQPDLRGTSSMQRILADSDPGASGMFQSGLELVNQGDFSNARRIFQEVLSDYGWDCNQNKIAAPAYWSIGLTYYQEGGETGLSLAGTFFQSFLQTYPNCEAKELAQAAQINIAVIYMERMRLAAKEPARERAAQGAAAALKMFLEKWPDSPQAYAASLSLADVQNYLSKPR
jgi:hypothetical protein